MSQTRLTEHTRTEHSGFVLFFICLPLLDSQRWRLTSHAHHHPYGSGAAYQRGIGQRRSGARNWTPSASRKGFGKKWKMNKSARICPMSRARRSFIPRFHWQLHTLGNAFGHIWTDSAIAGREGYVHTVYSAKRFTAHTLETNSVSQLLTPPTHITQCFHHIRLI